MDDEAYLKSANVDGPHDTPLLQYNHAVRHVTVRQVLEAERIHTSAPYRIEKQEFERVILVANLSSMRIFGRCRKFDLDDGTGRINAQQWNNSADIEPDMSQLDAYYQTFPYVRVIGAVEQHKEEKSINVARLDVISSPYAPYHHILCAIRDTLAYEWGPPPQRILQTAEMTDDLDNDTHSTMFHHEPPATPSSVSGVPHCTQEANDNLQGENNISSSVLQDKGKGKADPHVSELSMPKANSIEIMAELSPPISTLCPTDTDTTSNYPGPSITPVKKSSFPNNLSGNTSGDSPSDLSPLLWSPSPAGEHQLQRSPLRDPYSHLSSLQRDIIRCIIAARDQNAGRQGIYPSVDGLSPRNSWEGLNVTAIIQAVSTHRPDLTVEVFLASIEELIKEGHVFCPLDDSHYSCT